MKKPIHYLSTVAIAIIVLIGVSYVQAWSGPSQEPPEGNTDAPINVGPAPQVKEGELEVGYIGKDNNQEDVYGATLNESGGLFSNLVVAELSSFVGLATFNGGINIPTNAKGGKVLTSDDDGNATWQNSSFTETLLNSPIPVIDATNISGTYDDYEVRAGTFYSSGQIPAGARALLVYVVVDDEYPVASSNEWQYKLPANTVWKKLMLAGGGDEQSTLTWLPLDSNGVINFRMTSNLNNNSYKKISIQVHGYR